MEHDEDSEEKFVSKIRTLRDVALDLTDAVKAQTRSLRGLEPKFSDTLYKLRIHIAHLRRADPQKFRLWLFYLLTSALFTFLLVLFYFIF